MSLHHAYHFTGYYQYVPAQSDPDPAEAVRPAGHAPRRTSSGTTSSSEVIDGYQPDIIYQDFDLASVHETLPAATSCPTTTTGPSSWNKDVVATYKDGFNNKGEVFDYERGGPADLTARTG